jgi:WD40 repeat protein
VFSSQTPQERSSFLRPRLLRRRILVSIALFASIAVIAGFLWWLLTRLPQPRLIAALAWNGTPVDQVLFSPDGRCIAVSGDGSVRLYEPATRAEKYTKDVASLGSHVHLAFTPDSRVLATGSYKVVELWDVENGTLLRSFRAHEDFITAVSISADGAVLVSAGHDGLIKLWEMPTGGLMEVIPGPDGRIKDDRITAISISPNTHLLAWIGRDRHTLRIWDLEAHKELPSIRRNHPDGFADLVFSTDSRTIATAHDGADDPAIIMWDLETGQPHQSCSRHSGKVNSVTFSRDGKWLAAGCGGRELIIQPGGKAEIWDSRKWNARSRWKAHDSWVTSIAFDPSGTTVVTGGHDGTIKLWDIADCIK